MKIQKTYITTGNRARLNLEIKVKGKWQRIDFSNGGLSVNGNARFQTSDPDIQKTLESSKMFGDVFKIQSQRQLEEPSKKALTEEQIIDGRTDDDTNDDTGDGSDETLTFPNFNSLRDYLVSEHECKGSEVKSLTEALATAKRLGIKVNIE